MKYRIIEVLNPFIAQRCPSLNGNSRVIIESGLDFDEAREHILNSFNQKYNEAFKTWEDVRSSCYTGITWTYKDGKVGYVYDSRYIEMEEEREEDEV